MSERRVIAVLSAFESAKTICDYNRAKRLAEGCDPLEQLAMVDTIISARKRVH